MHWNHRILHDTDGNYSIVEVFYSEDGTPAGWAEAGGVAESMEDLLSDLRQQEQAFNHPPLEAKDFKGFGSLDEPTETVTLDQVMEMLKAKEEGRS